MQDNKKQISEEQSSEHKLTPAIAKHVLSPDKIGHSAAETELEALPICLSLNISGYSPKECTTVEIDEILEHQSTPTAVC